jgi:DNA-binding transcriptional LysR family regulator
MRHVFVLAELGSFARSAAVLHLSQSALSRSIQVVEQQVGAALFLRTAAGVVPTDIGRLLAQRAHDIVQMAEDVEQGRQSSASWKAPIPSRPSRCPAWPRNCTTSVRR